MKLKTWEVNILTQDLEILQNKIMQVGRRYIEELTFMSKS